ncbi:MAG: ribonuclease III [Oscillospiraceae bacterium]|nr:ribonuclease III [Oscillospiraceae bacterium]
MTEFEQRLGYTFKNAALLENALTHSSYANENRCACGSNERLEFLGDSILGMAVAGFLYKNCPNMPEGKMSRLRAELVCEDSLYEVAKELRLGDSLRLGHGEERSGGRERPSILADAVEAVIAAIYLDSGADMAKKVINRFILSRFKADGKFVNRDWKTALQEYVQREAGHRLEYVLIGERGPDHSKIFTVSAVIDGQTAGTGDGRSKKEAEQTAAKSALEKFER